MDTFSYSNVFYKNILYRLKEITNKKRTEINREDGQKESVRHTRMRTEKQTRD